MVKMSDSHSYPHEPTGVETRKLGMWIFLSTEILFFGTLITTFMIFKGRDFPGIKLTDVYDIPFTSVSSFVLLMSSLTMVLAHNALESNDQEKTRVWLLATAMLGAVFLAGQIYEFTEFYHKGFELSSNIFSSTFYVLTGFHGLHVFIGSCFLFICLVRLQQHHFTKKHHFGFEAAAWYWHFVDVVWLFLFVTIYWWGGL
jgi:heme/copper-type cytochrome/quinol oxidase subunit 3